MFISFHISQILLFMLVGWISYRLWLLWRRRYVDPCPVKKRVQGLRGLVLAMIVVRIILKVSSYPDQLFMRYRCVHI